MVKSNKERDLESHFPVVNKKDAGCKLWSAEGILWVVLPLKGTAILAASPSHSPINPDPCLYHKVQDGERLYSMCLAWYVLFETGLH